MPTFTTPDPIDVAINIQVGAIDIVASDRTDTVVTVSPSSPSKAVDRRGTEDTRVEFDGQRLTITGPRFRLSWIGAGPFDSVDVRVEVPVDSRLTAESAAGNVRTVGRLGATRIKASTGFVEIDACGDLWVRAGHGNATVGTALGDVEVTADHGQIRVGTVAGNAMLKSAHGGVRVGSTGGDLEAKLSYGDLEVAQALASVTAKTAYGAIEIDEVSSGFVEVESGYGQLTVGVLPGVAAWLDLSSRDGRVRNELEGESAPDESEQTVAVRARTQFGDITINHAIEGND